jgi:hypothetical protein
MDYIKIKKTWWYRLYLKKIENEGNASQNDFMIECLENMQLFTENVIKTYDNISKFDLSDEKYVFALNDKNEAIKLNRFNKDIYYLIDFKQYELLNFKIALQFSILPFYENQNRDEENGEYLERYSRFMLCPALDYYRIHKKFVKTNTEKIEDLITEGKIITIEGEQVYFDYLISALDFTNKEINFLNFKLSNQMFTNFLLLLEKLNPKFIKS